MGHVKSMVPGAFRKAGPASKADPVIPAYSPGLSANFSRHRGLQK
jgi:hypothetical protein